MRRLTSLLLFIVSCITVQAQDVQLFESFNGRYDYLAFGNTLNTRENGADDPCQLLTATSADLTLQANQTVVAAYLYWAGSLDPGDLDVTLNGTQVTAERDFSLSFLSNGIEYTYFAAVADVTDIVLANGNTTYTLTDLDVSDNIAYYCNGNSTNFAGWAVTLIYEDPSFNLTNINIFEGLESVNISDNQLTIVLDNLNIIDADGAKIGFLAWEGDSSLAVEESLRINGNLISNPPLNPANNAFNSTNSFTGANDLYNMDIDVYNVENVINAGDTQAVIDLNSGQDFVMINNIVTVFNSELPDATVAFSEISYDPLCGNRTLEMKYTVFNENSTAPLPINTPIAIYANNTVVVQTQTNIEIPIGGSAIGFESITIPEGIPSSFNLQIVVDDTGDGTGIIEEINEDNNEDSTAVMLHVFPEFTLQDLEICNAVGLEIFDLTEAVTVISDVTTMSFYLNQTDAETQNNAIISPEYFTTESPLLPIYARIENEHCFKIESFSIGVAICPLPDATIRFTIEVFPCRMRAIEIEYTVYNLDGTALLPAQTPIAFTFDGILVAQSETQNDIAIDGSENGFISFNLPDSTSDYFILAAYVDNDGTGQGIVEELDETNNLDSIDTSFGYIPDIPPLPDMIACDLGFNTAIFNLREQDEIATSSVEDGSTTYYPTELDALQQTNPIFDPENYRNTTDPQEIFIRLENEICFTIGSFTIATENCKPQIPEGFSPNGDGVNDVFHIEGLQNVFEDYHLKIFNRYGTQIYEGGPELEHWDGIPNDGLLYQEKLVPVGTYYYVLHLNDPNFTKPLLGFVYVNY
ncbi:hypothetical protein SCB49_14175 [unidentified eubacterium SCB49]|nr:hypothetical protein SCB49_14175 [unidentified eubacterium SCB49]